MAERAIQWRRTDPSVVTTGIGQMGLANGGSDTRRESYWTTLFGGLLVVSLQPTINHEINM